VKSAGGVALEEALQEHGLWPVASERPRVQQARAPQAATAVAAITKIATCLRTILALSVDFVFLLCSQFKCAQDF